MSNVFPVSRFSYRGQAQLLVAETRAEMLRARVLEEENERAKRSVRTAAAAMARRATTLVEELCSRNRRMARRAAGLREGVEVRGTRCRKTSTSMLGKFYSPKPLSTRPSIALEGM